MSRVYASFDDSEITSLVEIAASRSSTAEPSWPES
jgi:hypothetical protein